MLTAVSEIAGKEGYEVRGLRPQARPLPRFRAPAGIKSQTVDSFLAKGF